MQYLFCLAFFAFAMPQSRARADSNSDELPRAGAPRPLRLVTPDGAPLAGLPSDVAWENRGGGVFFTLERGGTRNIWRAAPDPQDASRFPAWRALPVTDLRAPRYAAQPCLLPGDRALACVSNVLAGSAQNLVRVAQIVRFDLRDSRWTALSDGARLYDSPRVSPDGRRVAFAGVQGAQMRVFLASAVNPKNRVSPDVKPVVDKARRPIWLDNNALLIESLVPNARGLYSISLNQPALKIVVDGGGEANTLGENGIVFSAKTAEDAPPRLYLIARDGSGLRSLSETDDARRPATSSDGATLAFDAPQNGVRSLYVLPLLRAQTNATFEGKRGSRLIVDASSEMPADAPFAQLASARAANEGIAIIGNLRGGANSVVTLEVGEGEKPRRWEKIGVVFPPTSPLLDAQNNRVLAFWNPPPRARGAWTFRLSLNGLGGGAQSLLRVRLPLPLAAVPLVPATKNAANADADADAQEPLVQTPPTSPLPRATPLIPDVSSANNDDLPRFPAMQAPDSSEIPSLIPPIVLPPIEPLAQPSGAVSPFSIPPVILAPPKTNAPDTNAPDTNAPDTNAQLPVPVETTRVPPPAPTPEIVPTDGADTEDSQSRDDSNYGEAPAATKAPFVAQFNVASTPARMEAGQKTKVTFWGWNRGTSAWQTGGTGENRVRLVARWIDFSTGTRRGWNFFWLREAVAAGERTNWDFDLTAPARPGKYKLIYGLVRVPASGEFKAPAYSAPQDSWDGEFGAIAFAVDVAPK